MNLARDGTNVGSLTHEFLLPPKLHFAAFYYLSTYFFFNVKSTSMNSKRIHMVFDPICMSKFQVQ